MWRAVNPDGTLTYTFVEASRRPIRSTSSACSAGLLYLSGMLVMAYNVWKTVAGHKAVDAPIPAPAHA